MSNSVRQQLDAIVGMIEAGELEGALAASREALEKEPDDVNLVAITGAILLSQKDLDAAAEYLSRAVSTEPAFLKPREDLGMLYMAKDQPDQAVTQFKKALAIDPSSAKNAARLAAALDADGREDEARDVRQKLMERLPVDALLSEAETLCEKGNTVEAEKLCDAVLRREPENIRALKVLAMAANESERYVIAEAFLTRILRLSPGKPAPLIDLAIFLKERSRYDEAIDRLTAAADLDQDDSEIFLMLGNLYAIVGRSEDSMAAYERCLEIDPDNPPALVGRGHLLRIAGRQDEALADYRRCLELSPDFGTAWWYLLSLRRFTATDEDVAAMRQQLDGGQLLPEAEVGVHFALARAAEQKEDFETAWGHYDAGNSKKRSLVSYDPVKSELEQKKIRATYEGDVLSAGAEQAQEITPIFIVGMPRSGSTLIEQIVSSHSQVEGAGELPYILMMTSSMIASVPGALHYTELLNGMSSADYARLGENYIANSASYRTEGKPFFTDKMPANFAHAGFIRQILPNARIIDARRNPMATCVANYRQLFAQGKNQSYDLLELAEYYIEYVKTMAHWDEVLPGTILRVQYEDVVENLESEVHRILDYCGLDFEASCLEFHRSARPVNTASAEQVREPIYRSGMEFWRHYEPHLDELKEVLAPVLN